MTTPVHKGWHRRGYLPHFDQPGRVQHVIFRLRGSLPRHLMEPAQDSTVVPVQHRPAIDDILDQGLGPRWLAEPEIAEIVSTALRHFDGQRYRLLAWCIMSNHVHVVVEQLDGWPLGAFVRSWKTFTARAANRVRGVNGPFWAKDYFDRYVRDEGELTAVIDYAEANAVKAGLCRKAQDWPWSSAAAASAVPAVALGTRAVQVRP